jgi:hypothetical protein
MYRNTDFVILTGFHDHQQIHIYQFVIWIIGINTLTVKFLATET